IHLSHYFAVDTFVNLFTFMSLYFAVQILTEKDEKGFNIKPFLFFGAALGMAVASKVSTVPVAAMLPVAVLARLSKVDVRKRLDFGWTALGYMTAAAFVSLFTFRIFQPYAFAGPGFFGMRLNEKWIGNLRSLQAQSAGDIDWPPSIQWARRSILFSWQNMVLWGQGISFGIISWAGFLWMGCKILKGEWHKHIILWGWTAFYFTWQSLAFNPTMRYQLPVYPALAVFGGWFVVRLWDWVSAQTQWKVWSRRLIRPAVVLLGGAAVGLTVLWGLAFAQIYTRPVTRVAASEWIYENIPGPINLMVETDAGLQQQPVSFPYVLVVREGVHYTANFTPLREGTFTQVILRWVEVPVEKHRLVLTIFEDGEPDLVMSVNEVEADINALDSGDMPQNIFFSPDVPVIFVPDKTYKIRLDMLSGLGNINLNTAEVFTMTGTGQETTILLNDIFTLNASSAFEAEFQVEEGVTLEQIYVEVQKEFSPPPAAQDLKLTINQAGNPIASAVLTADLSAASTENLTFVLDVPVSLALEENYSVIFEMLTPKGSVTILGSAVAVESPWD
ncbi:MAG: hypothetical protein N2D54_12885, partial [Chloroflexota bacterium]